MNDPLAVTEDQRRSDRSEDGQLMEISRRYLCALESGEAPNRESILEKHPELREKLIECLDGIDLAFNLQKSSRRSSGHQRQDFDRLTAEPLGDFRIVREIGRGGMGVVYEAFQLSLARTVALKVLPFAAGIDERHRKRFLLEAQSAAQLHHPNIVPVYAVGCERGTHYYAMQLINGRTISATVFDELSGIRSGQLGPSTVVTQGEPTLPAAHLSLRTNSRSVTRDRNEIIAEIIAQAADAIEYAHSCGIVHRDVKPANLILDQKGKLWITDFGLAQIAANSHLTQTGDLLGTLRYMSPEQASGDRGVVDHRSDVYSLGATLYEMLTREPVFDGLDRITLLNQILSDDPIPPRRIDRSIPEELEVITLKALRQFPSDRYETAQAFGDDLRRFLDQKPILARRPTLIDHSRKWMRRHPSVVLSLLFALTAAVVSLAATTAAVTHQKSLTSEALQRELVRVEQAEKRLAIAEAAADEMIRIAENDLSISPMEEALRQRLLSSSLKYYESLIEQTVDNQAVQSRLRATRERAAKTLSDLLLIQSERDFQLLSDSKVQRDLRLSEAQKTLLQIPKPARPITGDAEMLVYAECCDQQLAKVLTPNQRIRLKQISLQKQGPPAMRDMIVSGELRMTNQQMQLIQNDIIGYFLRHQQALLFGGLPSEASLATVLPENVTMLRSPDDLMSPEIKSELMEILVKRLTPEQLAKWQEITGPRFDPE